MHVQDLGRHARGVAADALRGAHSYTTPEIVALAIEDGDPEYLAWIDAETSTPP